MRLKIGIVVVLVGVLVGVPSVSAGADDCHDGTLLTTGCTTVDPSTGDGDVTLVGNTTDPGRKGSDGSTGENQGGNRDNNGGSNPDDDPGTSAGDDDDNGGGNQTGDGGGNTDSTDGSENSDDSDDTDPTANGNNSDVADVDPGCSQELLCIDQVLVDADEDEEADVADREITIRDVASFRPRTGTDAMEPDGWSIVRLNANFFSSAEQNVQVGELFGISAAVRFTPYAWHWDYGDGESLDSDDPGASWEALGLEEFSRTPTSHEFSDEGTFTVRLTVDFHAEYRFRGGEWTAIAGSVSRTADPVTATVGTAQTVLVSGECTADSDATGC